MAETDVGRNRSIDISEGRKRIPIVSDGLNTVHLHPNVSLSQTVLNFGQELTAQTLRVSYTAGAQGFEIIPPDNFTVVSISSEIQAGLSRVSRDVEIQPNEPNITQDTVRGSLTINFTGFMATAELTVNQGRPPRITSIRAQGGGLTGIRTQNVFDDEDNRAQIQGSDQVLTMTITVIGEDDATYTINTSTPDLFTSSDFGNTVYTLDGSRTHQITVAAQLLDTEVEGLITIDDAAVDGTAEIFEFYFLQSGDNQPTLTADNISTSTPVRGFASTFDFTVENADNGVGSLQRSTDGFVDNIVRQAVTVTGNEATGTASVVFLTSGTREYRFVDSGGGISPTFTLTVSPQTPRVNGSTSSGDWRTNTLSLTALIANVDTLALRTLSGSNFTLVQTDPTSPTRGNISSIAYSGGTGAVVGSISNIPVNSSILDDESTIWTLTLTVGTETYEGIFTLSRTKRPENPITFPGLTNAMGTINSTDNNFNFVVRYDSARTTVALSDASATDDDIWADRRLREVRIVTRPDPNISDDDTDLDSYLSETEFRLRSGSTNRTAQIRMDQIRVTSS